MAEEKVQVEAAEGHTPEPAEETTVQEAFAQAVEESQGAADPGSEESVEHTSEPAEETTPDHITWARQVEGLYDESGNINPDAAAKTLYEVSRQAIAQGSTLTQLQQLIQSNPHIRQTIESALRGEQPPPAPESMRNGDEEEEKSDLDIFNEAVDERVQKLYKERIQPMEQRFAHTFYSWLSSQVETAAVRMREEFKDEKGESYFDNLVPDMNQILDQRAAKFNLDRGTYLQAAAEANRLDDELRSAAREADWPKRKQRTVANREQIEQRKLRAVLTPSGSSQAVESEPVVEDLHDAFEAAKRQLAAQGRG